MKNSIVIILLLLVASYQPLTAINSWELPEERGEISEEAFESYSKMIVEGPDCSFSFKEDGIYYWISDAEAKTVWVVNNHKFWAREYCYREIATVEFACHYINPYTQIDIEIPPTVEHDGVTYTVTDIWYNAFNGCDNLTSVKIPETVTRLSYAVFSRCANLKHVELSSAIKKLPYCTFQYCPSLRYMDLTYIKNIDDCYSVFGCGDIYQWEPSLIEELVLPVAMGYYPFGKLASLRRLHLNLAEPPQCDISFMPEVYSEATLYVPDESVEKYRADSRWSRFAHIAGESTAVADVKVDDNKYSLSGDRLTAEENSVEVYRVDGVLESRLQPGESRTLAPGLYIIRSNMSVSKALVR